MSQAESNLLESEDRGRLERPDTAPGSQDEGAPAAAAVPSGMASGPPSRFVLVDSLRGVAAMWVVLFHAYGGRHLELLQSWSPAPVLAFFEAGHLGVSIFFVLSGFVISYSMSRYQVDFRFMGRFALRRSIRLDPPYWMSIVLCLSFGYLSQYFVPDKTFRIPDARVLAAHLLYLQDILELPQINTIYWTLCLEIQFYLIFCLLMVLAHRFRRDESDRRSIRIIFVPAALLAAAWPLNIFITNPWPGLFLPFWYGFLIGVAACWAMQKVIPHWWFYAYASLLGVAGVWYLNSGVLVCVVTAVLLMEAARRGKLTVWLNSRAFLFVGMISYSLYLVHNPITGAFYRVAYKISGRSHVAEAFWFFPMIGVNIACAYGFWWLFERTSMALGHHVPLGKSRPSKRAENVRPGLVASSVRDHSSVPGSTS